MDIGLLADPTRCPDCAIALPGSPPECPACGLPLRGYLADQLWRVSVAAAGLLEERGTLIGRLRVSARVPAGADAAGPDRWAPPPQPHPGPSSGSAWLPPPRAYDGALGSGPADHTSTPLRDPARPGQMQRVLLGLGVLLLAVAALIFTVVAWGRIGIGGRSAILAALTAAAGWASGAARRRDLPGTAEALATLTTVFLLLDAFGARSADLAGLAQVPADVYWAAVVGTLAALGAGLWRSHPLHAVRHGAVIAAQLPLVLVGDRLPSATFAALLCAQGAAALALARRFDGHSLRFLAGAGGALAYLSGLGAAAGQAYGGGYSAADALVPAVCALAFAAVVAVVVARDAREVRPVQLAASAAATAALLLGAHAPLQRNLDDNAATACGAALVVAALAAICLTRVAAAAWRSGPLTVVAAGFVVAVGAVGEQLVGIAAGTLGWLDAPWTADVDGSARDLFAEPWTGSGVVPVTLAVLTAGAVLAARRFRSGPALAAAAALATGTALSLPIALDVPYLVAVLSYVTVGGALLAAAARLYGRAVLAAGVDGPDTGEAQGAPAAPWAYGTGRPARTAPSRATVTAAGLALAGSCALVAGLSWSLAARTATPWALVIALAAAAAAHLADPREDRPAPVACAALLLVAQACVLTAVGGGGAAAAGFAGVLTAAVLVALAARLPGIADRANERLALELTAPTAAFLAFLATLGDAIWASNALLAAGTAAALVALRSDRRPVAWASGLLVTASTWVRLAEAHVGTPEAYTTGPALALLVAGWWNRRGPGTEDRRSSWAAYAPGLTMGLLPSLVKIADDAGDSHPYGLDRPLLLGLAALVALLVGLRARLQAPLLIGAAVLATDAVILLAPYAAAVPRWVSIGGAGVLLLTLGVTYEKRLRDVRRLKARIEALG